MKWVESRRFGLLLVATFLVLILPAFSGKGILGEILFVASMSFLLIQSMIVASTKKSKLLFLRYFILILMITIFWLEPAGIETPVLDIIRLLLIVLFFLFVTFFLLRFIRKAPEVNVDVIITAVNIYLLMGLIFSSLAFTFYKLIPGAYNFPAYITEPVFVNFNYYSFITMTTVGYGDITPLLPQTQTLAYFIAVTGQLYVAIIMAFLVGKLLMKDNDK
ncbi:MAG: potassium channel family protein [Bacteroidales bacterium]|nr:potassium channel family protein [Bacteroidales bacterium]